MRVRGLAILALVASAAAFAACSASPGQGFDPNADGDDSDAGRHNGGGSIGGGSGGGGTLLPDGGYLLPDGSVITPPGTDGGFLGDGGAPTSRTSCGGSFCRGDQTCNAGSCVFPCTGTQVPGDYATIQAAINANIGVADLTICLKAQNYPESVSASSSPATPKSLTIIGVSSSVSTVSSLTLEYAPFSQVAIRGVGITGGVTIEYTKPSIQFVGSKITTTSSYGVNAYGPADLVFDGCDLSGSTSYTAIYFNAATVSGTTIPSTQKLTVRNSYVHDTGTGISINLGNYNSYTAPSVSATIVNDTFNNDGTSFLTSGNVFAASVSYANNVVVNSKTYGIDQESTTAAVVSKNNALYANANNYAGSAVDGAGYVKSDLKLDTTQNPPGLGAGSPARRAADVTMAPTTDFWGVARPSSPDIGAVQN